MNSADLAQMDEDAYALGLPLILDQNFTIETSLTVWSPVVWRGCVFHIESNIRISFEGGIDAPEVQIFEYTDRSSRAYVRSMQVKAAWWGVDTRYKNGAFVKRDNNIPLQYALDSVAGSLYDPTYTNPWEGGTVTVPQGYCVMQGAVVNHGFVTIRGSGRATSFTPDIEGWTGVDNHIFKLYREITKPVTLSIANPCVLTCVGHGLPAGSRLFLETSGSLPTGLTAGTLYFVLAAGLTADTFELSLTEGGPALATSGTQSGTHSFHRGISQFNARLENCRIWGRGFAGVDHQVLAWSPQEQSGWFNVHFDAVYKNAITYQHGYGGAAMLTIDQCEFWLSSNAHVNAHLLDFDLTGFTDNWFVLNVTDCTIAGFTATGEQVGILMKGRSVLNISGEVHFENIKYGVLLTGQSCLIGETITGGPDINYLISTDNWQKGVGFIDVGIRKGSAANVYKDWATGSAITTDPQYGRLRVG